MARGHKTGGRRKGTRNKATRDVKAAAQKYTEDAIETLASVMRNSETDAARVSAAKELLDRGHNKVPQALIGGGENDPAIRIFGRIERVLVRPSH